VMPIAERRSSRSWFGAGAKDCPTGGTVLVVVFLGQVGCVEGIPFVTA
jgi:hypothetical protein